MNNVFSQGRMLPVRAVSGMNASANNYFRKPGKILDDIERSPQDNKEALKTQNSANIARGRMQNQREESTQKGNINCLSANQICQCAKKW